ncbi:MAG: TlyA family rRNA (cytidine-2'-O)-methyltransferase [Candidatus Wallbacteria bacterium HGW-Wallbacteria-1]|uniref:TlyA family rRNA (Cytidine-2'-O)-methyltransferase n=1 Tax=Candidatus Wallbacteria bacterium HGW-Wallbacteria-1 TaxID=2013854 RepID=A0A2N1PTK8_9BACT|nr:MAG: TlyA family rRNA (cytidine-2'-O)-methyltransferase [Candidatus Wallbacteria bacterium HGW-Wallbacteria-1]
MPVAKSRVRGNRLDNELVERGLVDTRNRAQRLIMAGLVRVNGTPVIKAAHVVSPDQQITVEGETCPYVSRGGLKLVNAIRSFQIDVRDQEFMDAGASTGGFTDCLLQEGATAVWAVDVGYGQLAWKLRQDPRVKVFERTNVRSADLESLGRDRAFDGLVADLSFIGLSKVLVSLVPLIRVGGKMILLVKPQFEAGREKVEKGGVVKDPRAVVQCAREVWTEASRLGIRVTGVMPSNVETPHGNVELLLFGVREAKPVADKSEMSVDETKVLFDQISGEKSRRESRKGAS